MAGAEGLALACEHDHTHAFVTRDLVDGGDQRLEHLEGERVELLRTVQRQRGHAALVGAQQDGFRGNGGGGRGAHAAVSSRCLAGVRDRPCRCS